MTTYALEKIIRETRERCFTLRELFPATDLGAALPLAAVAPIVLDRGMNVWPTASDPGDVIFCLDPAVTVTWEAAAGALLTKRRRGGQWLLVYERPAAVLGVALAKRASGRRVWAVVTDQIIAGGGWWSAVAQATSWNLTNITWLVCTTGLTEDTVLDQKKLRSRLASFALTVVETDARHPKSVIDSIEMAKRSESMSAIWLPLEYGEGFEELETAADKAQHGDWRTLFGLRERIERL